MDGYVIRNQDTVVCSEKAFFTKRAYSNRITPSNPIGVASFSYLRTLNRSNATD